jgi:hypothetical protein
MPGDYSRKTFDGRKHYVGVLMQQGRVQLDADWNEQQRIGRYRDETEARDVIGSCGAPLSGGGYGISSLDDGRDLRISPGRIYVDGLLCENEPASVPAGVVAGSPPQVRLESIYVDGYPLRTGDWVELSEPEGSLSSPPGPVGVSRIISVDEENAKIALDGDLGEFQSSPALDLHLRRVTTFLTQPDYPNPGIDGADASPPSAIASPPDQLNLPEGLYLAYLDVWQREVTALDDPRIREVALGGPDTAARLKTVRQVRLLEVASSSPADVACTTAFPEWDDWIAPGSGRLNARTKFPSPDDDPCELPPSAGYRRLENQLYRVEVHQGGSREQATFKWSRDNGSVETKVIEIDPTDGTRVTVSGVGKDEVLGFQPGQWVEPISDEAELKGKPHPLVRIADVFPDRNLIVLEEDISLLIGSARKLRRWDQTDPVTAEGVIAHTDAEGWLNLEGGIQIQFHEGTYRSGDYWLIPARTVTGEIEWPPFKTPNVQPVPQPPDGIHHHYCRLALIEAAADGGLTIHDCRCRFPSLNQTQSLYYVSGDGQEAMPLFPSSAEAVIPLPKPLLVGVVNSQCREDPARVRFTVTKGTGRVKSADDSVSGAEIDLVSDENGLVECHWDLGADLSTSGSPSPRDQNLPSQQVQAQLLDENDEPVHLPIRFNANLSVAEQVAYDPGACQGLAERTTVQTAIDRLAEQISLYKVSGDAQVLLSGQTLQPIRVRAANRCGPVPLQPGWVVFTVLSGGGGVSPVTIDGNGIASCSWTLGPGSGTQELEVTLQPAAGPAAAPTRVVFTARRSAVGAEPGIRVKELVLNDGAPLVNDTNVTAEQLARGIRIICDRDVDPGAVKGKPVCFLILELPYPFSRDEFDLWGDAIIGFRPLVLAAQLGAEDGSILWLPSNETQSWLVQQLFQMMAEFGRGDRILARLTLQGNFIWAREDLDLFMDGEVFGLTGPAGNTSLRLPGGDDRRGGDLEMWFWVVPSQPPVGDFVLVATPVGNAIVGAVRDVTGSPIPGVTVNLSGAATRVTSTNDGGSFRFPDLSAGTYRVFVVIGTKTFEQSVVIAGIGGGLLDPRDFPNVRLEDVSGIGPVLRTRLEERVIDHPALVASMEAEVLAEILDVSAGRARTLIDNARRSLEG